MEKEFKALIIHTPIPGRADYDSVRFKNLNKILSHVGIDAVICAPRTQAELVSFLDDESPQIVYSADYFVPNSAGEHVNIHQLLEDRDIPYIGSDGKTLDLVLSKAALKERWMNHDVRTPAFFISRRTDSDQSAINDAIRAGKFPYILKPNKEGNSRGLDENSIVFNPGAAQAKIKDLLKVYPGVLIERYLGSAADIREFTVAMIGNGNTRLLMPAGITLKTPKPLRIITTQDKDEHNTAAAPVEDLGLREELIRFADRAFSVAGVRDYARCDLLMTGGLLYAIEINGQPMIPDKWFAVCAKGAGLDSEQYLQAIFLAGIQRNIEAGFPLFIPPQLIEALSDSQLVETKNR